METKISNHIKLTVFPFENVSLQPGYDIYCRSFSTDLITELSRFQQFRIINLPRQSENSIIASDQLLEQFTSDYFIQGTFRSEKETARINVQLYNGHSRHMVWADRLEGRLSELSSMQDNLLTAVVNILQQQINADLLSMVRKRPRVEFGAYQHWLYGMEELRKGSVENDLVAREHFTKALEMQPDYSLAYTGMSLSYFNEWSCQLWERWDISKTAAYEWAQKAIELDDRNYLAAMVLGKIFMYEGSYDTAEYYFRRSLALNSNDTDSLLQIALCFITLGLQKQGIELLERAIDLQPLNSNKYIGYCVFIYFELGEYEKAAALIGRSPEIKIANAYVYYAATHFQLKQFDKIQTYWDLFLDKYRKLVSKGKDFTTEDAIDWLLKISPYRHKTNLEEFLSYISNGKFERQGSVNRTTSNNIKDCFFLKEAAVWKLFYAGEEVQVLELKGFYDIQKMLVEPFKVFHSAELMGSTLDSGGEKIIDEKARKQYQKRILELQKDIQEAEHNSDFGSAEKLQQEYDHLIDHLSKTLGLKGKARETGGTVEKARAAVTWRIRKAIARIEQYHPVLGTHLSNAIKTGTVCSYQPEQTIDWVIN